MKTVLKRSGKGLTLDTEKPVFFIHECKHRRVAYSLMYTGSFMNPLHEGHEMKV